MTRTRAALAALFTTLLLTAAVLAVPSSTSAASLVAVPGFGSNPGNLQMYEHSPGAGTAAGPGRAGRKPRPGAGGNPGRPGTGGQAFATWAQKSRIQDGKVGPGRPQEVRRTVTVLVAGTMWAAVPVPPTHP